mgnify:FL=1
MRRIELSPWVRRALGDDLSEAYALLRGRRVNVVARAPHGPFHAIEMLPGGGLSVRDTDALTAITRLVAEMEARDAPG